MSWFSRGITEICKFSETIVKRKIKLLWLLVALFGLVGILAATISTFVDAQKDANVQRLYVKAWLYFTFLSNLMIFIYAFLRYTRFFDKYAKTMTIFKNIIATGISITCLVSWTLLVKDEVATLGGKSGPVKVVSRIFNHTLNPIVFVGVYLLDIKINKTTLKQQHFDAFFIMIFPMIWLLMATIIYFSLGAEKEDAFYSFLAYKQNKWWMTLIYLVGITVLFGLFGVLYTYITIVKSSISESKTDNGEFEVLQVTGKKTETID